MRLAGTWMGWVVLGVLAGNAHATNVKTAVILVKFTDTQMSATPGKIVDYVHGRSDSVRKFFEEGSYNQLHVTGLNDPFAVSDVYPPAGPGGYVPYTAKDSLNNPASFTCDEFYYSDTLAPRAKADLNIPNTYQRYVFVFQQSQTCIWRAHASTPGANVFAGADDLELIKLLDHELGHTYGLREAVNLECGDDAIRWPLSQYCFVPSVRPSRSESEPWDSMGRGNDYFKQYNVYEKKTLGWIPDARIRTVTGSGTYTIRRLQDTDPAQPSQLLGLKIPIAGGDNYWVEYRQPVSGQLDSQISATCYDNWGSAVHLESGGRSFLIDTKPRQEHPTDDCYSLMNNGNTFSDPTNLVTVKQISKTSTTATYNVTLGCARKPPTLSDPSGDIPKGGARNFTLQLTNNDVGAGCGNTTFSLSGTNFAGGTISFSGPVSLGPGGTTNVSMTVSAPATCQEPNVEIEARVASSQHSITKLWTIPLDCAGQELMVEGASLAPIRSGSCPVPAMAISLTPTSVSSRPGTTQTFNAVVSNYAMGDATILLAAILPAGWTGSVTPSSLNVRQAQSGTATFSVTIPSNAAFATFTVGLRAANQASPYQDDFATSEVVVDDHGIADPMPPVAGIPGVTVTPDARAGNNNVQVTYAIRVMNNSASTATFDVQAISIDLATSVFPSFVTALSGQSADATLTVTVPAGLGNGSYGVTVTATDLSNATLTNSATAIYTVRNCSVVAPELSISPTTVDVPAGAPVQYVVNVVNYDSTDCPATTFRMASTLPGAGWTASYDPPTLTLRPYHGMNAWLTLTSPASATPADYPFTVSATDTGDSAHVGSVTAHYVIPAPIPFIRSIRSGNWSDPTIWSGGVVPTASDIVNVRDFVTVDTTNAHSAALYPQGHLAWSRTTNSTLTVHNGEIVNNFSGWIDMGYDGSPIPAGVTAKLRMESTVGAKQLRIGRLGPRFTGRGATKTLWVSGIESVAPGATLVRASMPPSGGSTLFAQTARARAAHPAFDRREDPVVNGPDGIIIIPEPPEPPDGGGGPSCVLPRGWSAGDVVAIDAERRTISSFWCDTSSSFVIALSSALTSAHAVPPRIVNVTRNVVLEAGGSNQAYFRNETFDQYDPAVDFNFAEFALLGGPGAGGGIQFVKECYPGCSSGWPASTGIIRNSVFRDSTMGLSLVDAARSTFENNVFIGNQSGMWVTSSTEANLFASNYVVGNTSQGWAFSSSSVNTSNTFLSNTFAFNPSGFNMPGTNTGNLFVSNQFNNNPTWGFAFGGVSSAFYDNYTYANGTDLYQHSGVLDYTGGAIGYDRSGAPRPATTKELDGNLKLNLGGVQAAPLNLARATPYSGGGANGEEWYVMSANQKGEPGTLRLSGARVLTGSLTLDHLLPLQPAYATAPKLLLGVGHAATVTSVVEGGAQSQRVSIRRVRGDATWSVEGSRSGTLGTFTGPITNQGFPAGAAQFYLTFTPGPAPADVDLVDFLLVGSSLDGGTPKSFIFEPVTGGFRAGNKSIFTVAAGATFTLRGVAGAPATMGCDSANCVYYTFRGRGQSGGVGGVTFDQAEIRNLDSLGLQLSGTEGFNLTATKFDNIGNDGGTPAYITLSSLTSTKQFSNITFANTPAISPMRNVNVMGTDSGLNWYFASFAGAAGGPSFEVDPNRKVNWRGYGPVAPSGLQMLSCTSTGFTMRWIDNSTDETEFHMRVTSPPCIGGCGFRVVATPNKPGTGYYVTGSYPIGGARGWFHFSVRSANVFGDESTPSPSASCYVPVQ